MRKVSSSSFLAYLYVYQVWGWVKLGLLTLETDSWCGLWQELFLFFFLLGLLICVSSLGMGKVGIAWSKHTGFGVNVPG